MSEWTPTDDEAASMFIMGWCCDTNPETARTEPASAWSRWLAAHDREVRREYGERISDRIERISIAPYLAPRAIALLETMRERAARIARGKEQAHE